MSGDMDFSGVSETLFLPLYALALESRRRDPIMVDEGTVDLTRRLNSAFAGSDKKLYRRLAAGRLPGTLLTTMTLRIRRIDRYVKDFLEREPDGIVVSLGCGLDDRRRRVDNGTVRWFDLDLPDVIALRRRFLPETDRMRFIASSVLDFSWLDELPDEPGHKFLFVAEGLFMYLPADSVRSLVCKLSDARPGSELVAEVTNSWVVPMTQGRWGRGKFRRQFSLSEDVVFRCGVRDSRELEGWHPGLALLGDWIYYDDAEPKLRWMAPLAVLKRVRWLQWVVHYRLGEA
jgi:O-methyltransferase involved in polyketide biosynthesis